MKTTIKMAVMLAVVFSQLLVQPAISAPPTHATKNEPKPIWKIFIDGTDQQVTWVDAINPMFAVYDAGTPDDTSDDIVLDKATGLVWERTTGKSQINWESASAHCTEARIADRSGWRLPTVEELASLVANFDTYRALPTGHPFILEDREVYWSATTNAGDTSQAYMVDFYGGFPISLPKSEGQHCWCVRGGYGHDGR